MLDRSRLDLQNKSNLIDPVCVLIPMPITPQRRKERGFNQCELLTDEIKRLDKENRIVIINNLLLRIHNIAHQTLKDRAARLESTKGIFSINKEIMKLNNVNIKEYNNMTIEQLKKTQIVIIDDVITTGSTMREAMDTLKSAGFENVIGISLAH